MSKLPQALNLSFDCDRREMSRAQFSARRFHFMIRNLALTALSVLSFSSLAFSQTTTSTTNTAAPSATATTDSQGLTAEEARRRDEMIETWRKQKFSFTVSPVYVNQSRDNINQAFTSNGFASPRQDFIGWDFRFKHQWHTGFQSGLEYFAAGSDRDLGSNVANFEQESVGLYFGYQPLRTERFSLSVGSGIGATWSKVEVFSAVQDGRVSETSWYVQPAVQAAFQLTERFGLGITAAYMAPFSPSEKVVGDDLGSRDIAIEGFLGKVDLILGRF
jgi:hypothetical protein